MPATGGPNPLLERIIADPVLLNRYRKEARKILEKSFEPDRLCKVIDAKYKLIEDDLKTDPFPHRRATVPGDRSYDDIVVSMKSFVRKRYASAVEQLDKPGDVPKSNTDLLGFRRNSPARSCESRSEWSKCSATVRTLRPSSS